MNIEIGNFAISKSGHDKGHLYVIIKTDDEYVYLVDGKIRTLSNPKKKNKKHIQIINYKSEKIIMDINEGKLINETVKRCLKLYMREQNA